MSLSFLTPLASFIILHNSKIRLRRVSYQIYLLLDVLVCSTEVCEQNFHGEGKVQASHLLEVLGSQTGIPIPFDAEICSDICLRTLSISRSQYSPGFTGEYSIM